MHCHIVCKLVHGSEHADAQRSQHWSQQISAMSDLVKPLSALSGQDSLEVLYTAAALTVAIGVVRPTTEA